MSFDKVYPNRKDKLKPYRRSKAFDRTCRNHNSCPWCKGNRIHSSNKQRIITEEKLKDEYDRREPDSWFPQDSQ